MASNDYRFLTIWTVEGSVDEAAEVIEDVENLVHWWPAVYLSLLVEEPGGKHGIGKRVRLLTRGWLPYNLRWTLTVLESEFPVRYVIGAEGDLDGIGVWTLKQASATTVDVTFDWQIVASKPLIRLMSGLLKPIFEANHRWAMKKGEQSLQLEIRRRRALREGALVRSPRPPGPALYSGPLLIGIAALLLLKFAASRARCRRSDEEEA